MKISQWIQNPIVSPNNSSTTETRSYASLNTNATTSNAETTKLEKLFLKYNKSLDTDTSVGIDKFLQSASGSEDSKMQTIEVALSQNVDMTEGNLLSIHEALNDMPLTSDQIETLLTENKRNDALKTESALYLKLPERLKQIIAALSNSDSKSDSKNDSNRMAGIFSAIETGKTENQTSEQQDLKTVIKTLLIEMGLEVSDESTLKEMISLLSKVSEGDIDKAMSGLMDSIKADIPTIEGANEILLKEVSNIEMVKNEPISKGISSSEVQIEEENDTGQVNKETAMEDKRLIDQTSEDKPDVGNSTQMLIDEMLMTLSDHISDITDVFDIKAYLIKETTELTESLKSEFNTFKQTTESLLSSITNTKDTESVETKESIESTVQKAIEKVDHLITKSEITLYTGMQTERNLMVASSELSKALSMVQSGDTNGALEIVKSTNELIQSLQFSPENKRVELFATQRTNEVKSQLNDLPPQTQDIKAVLDILKDQTDTRHARDTVETIRYMGNNHEVETANQLEYKDQNKNYEIINGNIKEILMNVMKSDIDKNVVESSEKTLMNLSGQQMMNDFGGQSSKGSQYFNLPFQDQEEINQMKVYITGKNNAAKIDWQNTEIYFGMNLNQYGDTGIRVKASDGALSVNIMNNQYEEIVSAFESLTESLVEIGFKTVKIEASVYNDEAKSDNTPSSEYEIVSKPEKTDEKGIDYRI